MPEGWIREIRKKRKRENFILWGVGGIIYWSEVWVSNCEVPGGFGVWIVGAEGCEEW